MAQPNRAFRAVQRSKVYSDVVDQILHSIQSGVFPAGSSLPAERTLAEQLAVSRGSLREAIRVLEHAGVLDVRVGSGTYVTDTGLSQTAMLRARATAVGEHSPLDLIVARAAIEPVCAEHAATAHRPTDFEHMQAAFDKQAAITRRGDDPAEADLAFHLAVATASHNGVLLTLEQKLIQIMHEHMWSDLKHRSRSRADAAEHYLEHHQLVLQAIKNRNPRRAHQYMSMHMSAVESGLVSELEHPGDR